MNKINETKLTQIQFLFAASFLAPPCSDAEFYQLMSLVFGASTLSLLVTCLLLWTRLRLHSTTTTRKGGYTLLDSTHSFPTSRESDDTLMYRSYQSEQSLVSYVRQNSGLDENL